MIGRLLGIDHGMKRIGIAVSDAMGIVARELCIIESSTSDEDFARIKQLAKDESAVAIVVGIPHNDSPEGVQTQADTVRSWILALSKTTKLPILEWDEQLTTQEANELARQLGRKSRDSVDDLAARVILQSYIDAVNDGLATPPPRP